MIHHTLPFRAVVNIVIGWTLKVSRRRDDYQEFWPPVGLFAAFALICSQLVNELLKETADVIASLSSTKACQSRLQPRALRSASQAAGSNEAPGRHRRLSVSIGASS